MVASSLILAVPVVVLGPARAFADTDEWRVALAGTATVTTTHAGGVDGQGLGFGGRARVGKGLTNNLEVGLEGSFVRAQALEFDSAELEHQAGTLYADTTTVELAAGLRWSLGVEVWRALERVHPFVGVRAGALVESLSGQELLNAQSMVLLEPRDELRLVPFVAGRLGVERRFGDHVFAGLAFDLAYGKDYRHLGGELELAWSFY